MSNSQTISTTDYYYSNDNINIDIYIVHMDANFYHPINRPDVSKDIAARKSQIYQLLTYIFNSFGQCINVFDNNKNNEYTILERNSKIWNLKIKN